MCIVFVVLLLPANFLKRTTSSITRCERVVIDWVNAHTHTQADMHALHKDRDICIRMQTIQTITNTLWVTCAVRKKNQVSISKCCQLCESLSFCPITFLSGSKLPLHSRTPLPRCCSWWLFSPWYAHWTKMTISDDNQTQAPIQKREETLINRRLWQKFARWDSRAPLWFSPHEECWSYPITQSLCYLFRYITTYASRMLNMMPFNCLWIENEKRGIFSADLIKTEVIG